MIPDIEKLSGKGTVTITVTWDIETSDSNRLSVALAQHTSAVGRTFIEAFEGCDQAIPDRPGFFTTYYDSVGVLTIGYGHTNLAGVAPIITVGMVLSHAECDVALSNDLTSTESYVTQAMMGFPLQQYQFDALDSFEFNTGDLGRSSIPSRLKSGDVEGAMAVLLEYNHAGGQVVDGLTRRREAERLMYLGQVTAALELAQGHASLKGPMMRGSR
jgi:lysozyme